MTRTFLLRAGSDEAAHAPEFRYLASWVELQARRALGEVVVVEDPRADLPALLEPADRVLLLASGRVLVGARSLAAMGRALERGAEAAVARRLAEVPGLAGRPVYTLRGFERLEEALLAGPGEGSGAAALRSLGPAALLTPRALERLLAGGRPGTGLLEAAATPPAGLEAARAGLCHEFIDYYGEVRSDVLPHVPAGVRRVLEVGCGRGLTGELLQRERGCRVTGVELNPVVAAGAARRLDRVVTGDIEDPAVAEELAAAGPWDLVLALELFEHLAEPEGFLLRARELLRPGGGILLSTPNVGHYSVVEDLLAGRWDYLPIGLLCYTHLRFFTRRTLEDWLGRLGFERFRLIPQETEEAAWQAEVGRLLEVDRPSLRTKGFWVVIEV